MKNKLYFYLIVLVVVVIAAGLGAGLTQKPLSNFLTYPTANFIIFYQDNSTAQQDIVDLANKLEEYFKEYANVFKVSPNTAIKYYFHQTPLKVNGRFVWGYADSNSIHAVYSSQQKDSSPHEFRHFINRLANPSAPYFFNEGVCGWSVTIAGKDFHQYAKDLNLDYKKITLAQLVSGFQTYGRPGDFLAYSFNSYLIDTYGLEKFSLFYRQVTLDNWEKALAQVYSVSAADLESSWKNFLENIK